MERAFQKGSTNNPAESVRENVCDCKVEAELRASLKRAEKQLSLLRKDLPNSSDYLDRALALALEFSSATYGFIAAYDDKKQLFSVGTSVFETDPSNPLIDHPRVFKADKANIWTEIACHRHVVVKNGLTFVPTFKTVVAEPASDKPHPAIHNLLAVPVFDHKRLAAVLMVVNKTINTAQTASAALVTAAASPSNPDFDQADINALELLMANIWSLIERKKSDERLKIEKDLFKTTLLSIGDGILATDQHGYVSLMNEVAQRLTGWHGTDAIGRPFDEVFKIIDERTRKKSDSPVEQILLTGRPTTLANRTVLITRDGSERPIGDSAAPIFDENGKLKGAVMAFRDATEEIHRLNHIEYLSFHDALTGLYNRHFFEEELLRYNTKRNLPISIVIGDVNGLKLTNDAFGHQMGDQLLTKAAEVLRKCCRQDDIIARIGGDEFVILLPKTTSEEAGLIVKRINELCSETRAGTVPLSISFGWDTKVSADEHINEVLRKAENWMYQHKLFESPSNRSKTIDAITQTLFETHANEEAHSRRVSILCERIGKTLQLGEREIQELKTTAFLHDIGKIAIDNHILNKPASLNDVEWREVRRHSEIGYRILSATDNFSDIASQVLAHHERWDGCGYPKGLAGNEIPLLARIITLADAYEAMTSERPYRPAHTRKYAINEILTHAGSQFDPELSRLFVYETLNYEQPDRENLDN